MDSLKHIILIFLGMATFAQLAAQNEDLNNNRVEWSAPYNEPPKSFLTKIIHTDAQGFHALRVQAAGVQAGKSDVFVEYYEKEGLKLKKSTALDLKFKNKRRDFEDVVTLKGKKMYFLTSFNNQAKKRNYLFAQPLNIDNLRPNPNLTKIAEVPTRNIYQEGGFRSHISKDTSKILIYAMLPSKKRQPERFSLQVFNEDFNEMWTKEITLPFNDDKFSVEEYRVDNEGLSLIHISEPTRPY